MKKLIATFAIVGAMFGTAAVFAPSASACTEEEACQQVRDGAVLVYKLTRLIF